MKVSWFMNSCERNQERISLLVAGLCPAADQQRVQEHLETCANCRIYLKEVTAIANAISGLKQAGTHALPSANLRARWMDQVLAPTPQQQKAKPFAGYSFSAISNWLASYRSRLAWSLGTAACVLLAFFMGYRHGQTERPDPLANVKMIRETLAMFPHRIRAMVEDEHGVSLILSDSDNVPASAPLYVRVCDGKHCTSFLTFSGQEIEVAGQKVTVLEDAHGGVILEGNEFVWSNAEPTSSRNHWQIEAKNLDSRSM